MTTTYGSDKRKSCTGIFNVRDFATKASGFTVNHPCLPFALVGVIGFFDFFMGPDLSFGLFYLIPILLVAWWQRGYHRVVAIGVLVALMWIAADLVSRFPNHNFMISLWNAATRLGIFWIVGFMTQYARYLVLRQQDLMNYVVHDLRSPLLVIMNTMEILSEGKPSDFSLDIQEYLKLCQISAQRMSTMITSILDLRRLEDGKMNVTKHPVHVDDAVQASIREASLYARIKNIVIQKDIADSARTVCADPLMLHRILANILSNAIKASREGTKVSLRAYSGEDGSIIFSVTDSGSGVPPAYLSCIFTAVQDNPD